MVDINLLAMELVSLKSIFSNGIRHKMKNYDYFLKSDKNGSSENYRYWLSCRWESKVKKFAIVIGKNPSIGFSKKTDHTLSKIRNCLRKEGFDGFIIVNRNPVVDKALKKARFRNATGAIKEKNSTIINRLLEFEPDALICAWGSGINKKCGVTIEETLPIMGLSFETLRPIIKVFGINKDNSPRHPCWGKIFLVNYLYE